jgi:hypothetical protein
MSHNGTRQIRYQLPLRVQNPFFLSTKAEMYAHLRATAYMVFSFKFLTAKKGACHLF